MLTRTWDVFVFCCPMVKIKDQVWRFLSLITGGRLFGAKPICFVLICTCTFTITILKKYFGFALFAQVSACFRLPIRCTCPATSTFIFPCAFQNVNAEVSGCMHVHDDAGRKSRKTFFGRCPREVKPAVSFTAASACLSTLSTAASLI